MTSANPYTREKALRLHRDCIDNARRLLDAAERLLVGDHPLANIAFHLATLALEEVAKAGLILTLSLRTNDADTDWTVKRLDDHEAKLMWALWTPAIGLKAITQEQMEKTWKAARRIHATRLQAVYVNANHDADPEQVPAKAITLEDARRLIEFARGRIEIEGAPTSDSFSLDDEKRWFLTTISDPDQLRQVLGSASMQKLKELGGDTSEWVRWLKQRFDEVRSEADAIMQKEFARTEPTGEEARKPKWRVRVRLHSATHAIRPKVLSHWNGLIKALQLSAVDKRKQELHLDITLTASVSVHALYYASWGLARQFVAALNVGSMGFFWWHLPQQTTRFYERVTDLEAPHIYEVAMDRMPAVRMDWGNRTLTVEDLNRAARVFYMMTQMGTANVDRVFGQYFGGLIFTSKTDLHFDFSVDACHAFAVSLFEGMRHFEVWDGDQASIDDALHAALADALKPEGYDELTELAKRAYTITPIHRPQFTVTDASKIKLVCDVFFVTRSLQLLPARAFDQAEDPESSVSA